MPLFNVRLAADDARLVRDLRGRGVRLSEVVRQAIRNEAQKASAAESVDVAALLAEMVAAHPAPSGERPRRRRAGPGRREIKRIIRSKLQRRS